MKYYNSYMGRQQISPALHEKLLSLEPQRKPARPWVKYASLAACCALIFGMWRLAPRPAGPASGQFAASADASVPGAQDARGPGEAPPAQEDPWSFTVESGAEEGDKFAFPMLPAVVYADVAGSPQMDTALAVMEGSFSVDLTKEQIQEMFWGPDGKPTPEHPKAEQGDLPWLLMWDGYTVSGSALYDGGGTLYGVTIRGEHPNGAAFTLSLAPERLPLQCGLYMDAAVTDVRGVEVTGWCLENTCVSELMSGAVGARFQNTGAPFQVDNGAGWDEASAAKQFNALFVSWATYADCPLTLDHLLKAEHVPEWRSADFDSLADARKETAFTPWLPQEAPAGFGDFRGRLTYQEGNEHVLWVRWSRGYDDVSVNVCLPEGDETYETVDVSDPAAYDMRLYDIPWFETVPEEYRDSFFSVACFRAEDMSLEVVKARGSEKDTGGMNYRFGVLHPDGTLVEYDCSGVSAEYVWGLVEATL